MPLQGARSLRAKLRSEALTLIPSLAMFFLAIYFSFIMLFFDTDYNQLRAFAFFSLTFMIAGLVLAFFWFVYWALYRGVTAKERK